MLFSFGLKNAEQILTSFINDESPREINSVIRVQLKEFIGENAQFDDITTLTIQYYGDVK